MIQYRVLCRSSYSYDALNRLTAITYPDPAENVTMTYDNCNNGIGRLCQVTDESGQYDYSYDVFGNQLALDFSPVNTSETLTTAYVYDSGDNVVQITYPSGRVINYTRDELSRIIAVDAVINGMTQNIVSNIEYRADGLITQMTHGNAMITLMDYDLQGRMLDKTLLAQDASTVVDERFYQYDADNNITARTGTPGDHSYRFDAVDKLIEQDITGAENIQYRYDLNGNRLERTIDHGSDIIEDLLSYQPDSNRLTEVISTELPNRATESQQSWIYNQANRMAAYLQDGAITTEYIVNSQGQRSHKINPATATQTVYHYGLAGYQILTETTTDASNTSGKDYLWLNGEPIAQIDTSNGTDTISYLHTDHLLTPRLATDATGLIIWRWEGEAFGDVQPQELAGIEINLRFPGQYYDEESGLHYNMFRDYNPESGRYVQSDPIGLSGGANIYEYSVNTPLKAIDQYGLVPAWALNIAKDIVCEILSDFYRSQEENWDKKIWDDYKHNESEVNQSRDQQIRNCGYICDRKSRIDCYLDANEIASELSDKNQDFLINGLNNNPFRTNVICYLDPPKKIKN